MIQLYFDANVWIDYCWNKYHSKKRLTRKKPNTIPINRINSNKAKIILCTPLLYEITSHFKDYFILSEVIAHGFSPFEFSKVRRNYKLNKSHLKAVEGYYNNIITHPTTKGQILVDWINQSILDETLKRAARFDIDFMDCLHYTAALIGDCDLFVTKDEGLIEGIERINRASRQSKPLRAIRPSEFLSSYKTQVFKK